jgi:hypothetical protein
MYPLGQRKRKKRIGLASIGEISDVNGAAGFPTSI